MSFDSVGANTTPSTDGSATTLGPSDWGMLILMLHSLQNLLASQERRFDTRDLDSVREDLAEVAGEKGTVSIRQQLQIVRRMRQSYDFLRPSGGGDILW